MTATILSARHAPEHYDHVRILTRPQLAWEYLRRNSDYRRDWRRSAPGRPETVRLSDDTRLVRPRRRFSQAEAWGLLTFR